ncbi:splicing factor 3B subunit 2 [Teleopsis dalmanni]|uniref:splicing factor 3B subunit 2 n=1 Tax=Teleopsis dalmanni TaxID=139649 RepID=UPI0018CE45A9|nr:splicing factor 3B subunit 2 [Teleopsis dalmanni]
MGDHIVEVQHRLPPPPQQMMPPGASSLMPMPNLRTPPPIIMQTPPNFSNIGVNKPNIPPQQWNPSIRPETIAEQVSKQQSPMSDAALNNSGTSNENADANLDDKTKKSVEVVLPKALEDVLALKDQRAAAFDENDDYINERNARSNMKDNLTNSVISSDYVDGGDESDDELDDATHNGVKSKSEKQSRAEKNKKKKKRKKQNRKIRQQQQQKFTLERHEIDVSTVHEKSEQKPKDKKSSNKIVEKNTTKDKGKAGDDVSIEYVPEKITIADLAPMYRQFYRVFEIFKLENKPKGTEKDKAASESNGPNAHRKFNEKSQDDDDDEIEEEGKEDKEKLSKRKLKKLTRLSVAELKQLVSRPDVVEMHDVTARDPKLLVQLKAYRNTVQVPRHWCFKRKYLQGKRGIEKPPFDLPAFIKKTGIMEMRESLQEKDDAKSLKTKMRERVRPKMGKIDIDYQKLHDAFFKWQTKPRMTIHGDLYYEGKEFETRLKEKKPGDLSEELRIALGMPVGPNSHKIPPPWLIAQQRYGPPPSYPNLKIPGLNAPIPEATSFGYHAGGWGKPPVDENGKPLYGDVFGTNIMDMDTGIDEGDIERNQWGELESESEESSDEEDEDGEDLTAGQDESGLITPAGGLVTPSGLTSVPAGMETPENIELRKKKIEAEIEDNETPVLYQVLPEKRGERVGASMMGSTHVYEMAGVNKQATVRTTVAVEREGTVELALDPSELDMDNEAMAMRYEQQMREQQNNLQKEDLSDMLAEHVARQKSKRKRQQTEQTKTTKKYKEFKF